MVGLIIAAGGTATAARLITSADIKNGSIKGKDIKAGTVTEKLLSGSVRAKLNAAGPQGPKGDPGAAAPGGFLVKDGDGKSVSAVVAVEGDTLLRVVDGALWRFRWDGTLSAVGVFFSEINCTGTAFLGVGSDGIPNPQLGVAGSDGQAYRLGSAAPQVRAFKSRLESDGECSTPLSGSTLSVQLESVSAPAELKGPLTVLANP